MKKSKEPKTHHIYLSADRHGSKAQCTYNSIKIGRLTKEPLFYAARYLLTNKLATEADTIETYRQNENGE